VQMFSANSPHWLNSVNNNIATNGVPAEYCPIRRSEQSARPIQQ
jgi:hypothetical protein